jgi:hypothetical protein
MKGKSMKASGLIVANAATTELLDRLPGLQPAKNLYYAQNPSMSEMA